MPRTSATKERGPAFLELGGRGEDPHPQNGPCRGFGGKYIMVLSIGATKMGPLIFGNAHLVCLELRGVDTSIWLLQGWLKSNASGGYLDALWGLSK